MHVHRGKSRGGFSTKVHVGVDGLGNPVRFLLIAGQCHDQTQAPALVKDLDCEFFLADKGYDTKDFLDSLKDRCAVAQQSQSGESTTSIFIGRDIRCSVSSTR